MTATVVETPVLDPGIAALVMVRGQPRVPTPAGMSLVQRLRASAHPQVLAALLINTLARAGEFTLFIYIAPVATGVTDVGAAGVSGFLLVWGVAAIAGSVVGGRVSDTFGGRRAYTLAVVVLLAGLLALSALSFLTPDNRGVVLVMFDGLLVVISVTS